MFQPLRASTFDAETRAVCIGSGRFVVRLCACVYCVQSARSDGGTKHLCEISFL